jgi:Ca2+-transporting ATPase
MSYYSKSLSHIISELRVDEHQGLSRGEVASRRLQFGENVLPDTTGKTALTILWNQINNILTYILVVAVVFSLLIDHRTDAGIIAFLIIVNISLGFYHEFKAEKRVRSLKNLVEHKCRVLRDGLVENIDTTELVPGDVVFLEDGQSVPADIRLLKSTGLTTIESSLTGESVPVDKETSDSLKENTPLGDRKNMVFMGTHVVTGECSGVVVATGTATEIGKISVQLSGIKEGKALFFTRTEQLMRQMIGISLATTVITIILLLIRHAPLEDIVQLSLATTISGIPEGLPSVLTVLLSLASVRMSKKNALLRNLPAIESR